MLGTGLLQGLGVTAKNFVGSFHDPARLTTIEYPEVKTKLPEAYRNFPFLVTENATDPMGTLRCVACQICEKECPPQCIYIEKSKDKKPDATGKPQLFPAIFAIDTSVCMSCQICVEVCPFDAIKMDQVYEIATTDRFSALLLNREQLAKSNAYYHEIHPTEAAEVDARLAQAMAARLFELGVYVAGFFFPVVPKDRARIRTQMNAALSRADLDEALAAFAQAGRDTGVLK